MFVNSYVQLVNLKRIYKVTKMNFYIKKLRLQILNNPKHLQKVDFQL